LILSYLGNDDNIPASSLDFSANFCYNLEIKKTKMERESLIKKIKHLVRVLVTLPSRQRDKIMENLEKFSLGQLDHLEKVLGDAQVKQNELMKKGFEKDPVFANKFDSFQEVQMQKMQAESVNLKNRDSMKDYLNFKAKWQKTAE